MRKSFKQPAKLVTTVALAEFTRYFWLQGYFPKPVGGKIYRSEQPELFFAIIAFFGLGAVWTIVPELPAYLRERKARYLGTAEVERAAQRFLGGGYPIGHSVAWSTMLSGFCIGAWVLIVAWQGSCNYQLLACGSWLSALVLAVSAYVLDARSLQTTDGGTVLLFKHYSSVSGNLAIPGLEVRETGSWFIFDNLGTRYRVYKRRFSAFDRRVLLSAFGSEREKR